MHMACQKKYFFTFQEIFGSYSPHTKTNPEVLFSLTFQWLCLSAHHHSFSWSFSPIKRLKLKEIPSIWVKFQYIVFSSCKYISEISFYFLSLWSVPEKSTTRNINKSMSSHLLHTYTIHIHYIYILYTCIYMWGCVGVCVCVLLILMKLIMIFPGKQSFY